MTNCPKCNNKLISKSNGSLGKNGICNLCEIVFSCNLCDIVIGYDNSNFIDMSYYNNDIFYLINNKGNLYFEGRFYFCFGEIKDHIKAYDCLTKFIDNMEFI